MSTWIDVCNCDDLQPDSGVCALVEGKQIAIFYLTRLKTAFAIGNFDPFSQAKDMVLNNFPEFGSFRVTRFSPLFDKEGLGEIFLLNPP